MTPMKKLCPPLFMIVAATGCAEFRALRVPPPGSVTEAVERGAPGRWRGDCPPPPCCGQRRPSSIVRRPDRPLPTVDQAFARVKAALENRGIRVVYWRKCPPDRLGEFDAGQREVRLCGGDARLELDVLAHEAGHAFSYAAEPSMPRLSKPFHEFVAESAATATLRAMRLMDERGAERRLLQTGIAPQDAAQLARLAQAVATKVVAIALGEPDRTWRVSYDW